MYTLGPGGEVDSLPKNFEQWTLIVASKDGINDALARWGGALQRKYFKGRMDESKDMAVSKLGAWTDHGSWFGFISRPNATTVYPPHKVLPPYWSQLKQIVPVHYLQLDAYWYPTNGWNFCISNFSANIKDFDHESIASFRAGLEGQPPLHLYGDFFCPGHNQYSTKYNFTVTENGLFEQVIPGQAREFYQDLFVDAAARYGMGGTETDWMIFGYLWTKE